MFRHVEVQNAPAIVREDQEAIQQPEGCRRHDEEVGGGNLVGVTPKFVRTIGYLSATPLISGPDLSFGAP